MTEADILQIARAKGDETDTGFIFNKEGPWSVLAFARALLADRDEREAALRAEVERLKAAIDMQPSPPTREDMDWAGKVFLAEAEKENDALRAEVEALRADAERFASFAFPPFCDEYAGVDLYEQASIYASAFGREEPNRDDYVAALRDAVDAAMAQAKEPK